MATSEVMTNRGARARLAFTVVAVTLFATVILSTGLEWGSLSVRRRLVVSETGTGEWQGILAGVAAVVGLVVVGFAVARGRARIAALSALLVGLVVTAAAVLELVHVATRPADLAALVRVGAESIPLRGYRVPLIESAVGPGTWVAVLAGVLLLLVGLGAVIIPAWRSRR